MGPKSSSPKKPRRHIFLRKRELHQLWMLLEESASKKDRSRETLSLPQPRVWGIAEESGRLLICCGSPKWERHIHASCSTHQSAKRWRSRLPSPESL